jgi:hypothetical protein
MKKLSPMIEGMKEMRIARSALHGFSVKMYPMYFLLKNASAGRFGCRK